MHYGIDVGGTKTEFAVFDGAFEKVSSHRISTPTENYEEFLSAISGLVSDADSTDGVSCSVGVGHNGIVDSDGRSFSANVPCINGKQVKENLTRLLDRRVQCLNDVHAFALSEAQGGAGDGYASMVGVILGTGVMGTMCNGGEVESGATGIAGEWGHIPIAATLAERYQLPLYECPCGLTACAECYISGPGLARLASHELNDKVSSYDCIERMRDGDPAAVSTFTIWIELVASSISQVILHTNPEVIVIGGGMSAVDELFERLPDATRQFLFKGVSPPPILRAKYGDASGVRGAAIAGAKI